MDAERDADWLSTEAAATLLRVDRRTLRHMVEAGQVPALRVGRRYRFRRDVVENLDWLSTEDAAATLRISAAHLRRMAESGQIPALRAGRVWRFRRSVLDNLGRGDIPAE